ncbi:MAG: HYR domain-containing protein [Bacteroidota bacterium]
MQRLKITLYTLLIGCCCLAADANSICSDSESGLILISSIDLNEPSSCGAGDGSIKVNAFGNPGPFQYSIDGGNTFFTNQGYFGNLDEGTYQIRVRGSNGCCMISAFPQTIACGLLSTEPEFSFTTIQNGWSEDDVTFWTCAGETVNIGIQVTDADQDDLVLGSPDPQVQELIGTGNFEIISFGNTFANGLINLTVKITPPVDFSGPLPFTLSVTDDPGNNPEFTTADYTLQVANLTSTANTDKACAGVETSFEITNSTYPENATINWDVISDHNIQLDEDDNLIIAEVDNNTTVGEVIRLQASTQVGNGNYSCIIKRSVEIEVGAFELEVAIQNDEESICGSEAIAFTANVEGFGASAANSQISWTSTGSAFGSTGNTFNSNFQGIATETVTATAQFGACSGTAAKDIQVNCPPMEISYVTEVASCEENNGNITISVEGGLAPYAIQWSVPGETATDLVNVFPGTYDVSVSDAIGNVVTSSIEVGVDNDEEAPSLSCPENITSISLDGSCQAPMPDLRLLLDVSDNCIGELVLSQVPLPGSFLPSGTTEQIIKFKAVDASGNVSTCEITLPVEDNAAPSVICGSVKAVGISATCDVLIPDMRSQVVSNDNCDNNLLIEQFPAPGTVVSENFDQQIIEVSVMDGYGNYSICSYQLEVEDHFAPVITSCQETILKGNDDGKCGALVQFEMPAVEDCSNVTVEQVMGLPSGELYPVGLTDVLFKATDVFGNTSFCGFTVQVGDFEAPRITVTNPNITLFLDASGKVNLTEVNMGITAEDNCGLDKFEMTPKVFYCSDIGLQQVRLEAVDYFGNLTEVDVTVEVKDSDAPVLFCSQEVQELSILEAENLTVNQLNVDATDNCGVSDLQITSGPLVVEPGLVQNVMIQASDATGNTENCQVQVKIQEPCDDEINVIVTNGNGLDPIFDSPCSGFQQTGLLIKVIDYSGKPVYDAVIGYKTAGNLPGTIARLPTGMYFYQMLDGDSGTRILRKGTISVVNQ